jgi:hypothetical protein
MRLRAHSLCVARALVRSCALVYAVRVCVVADGVVCVCAHALIAIQNGRKRMHGGHARTCMCVRERV